MTDDAARLVELALAGDADAADTLVRRHMGAAYAVALAITRNPQDAEDVAQDAFVLALERLAECRDPRRFAGWLIRIVRNRAFNHRRYLGIRAAEPLDEAFQSPGGASPADDAERADLRDRLNAAVAELPQSQREVLLLHDLEGWKHREIGEVLGMPEGTVRYHLFNARRAVRGRLQALVREED
ncbi:RNA polymerase sigma factor [Longimicrobium terrae]|uniref:RNA polymerase sigma-70 factor (ECF subfamily) n=1 Tax=Longimicrobium terrae TaxID=1639882 RepID=A0A841GZ57_9BACT|nr:sigma-70 family RNA polymerase sigma factor [Longimicrobium terrae]MBB4636426.1 RNA polymerase sigma-70 factor (ECF subfamily) [Longimicrobium terrae]MBB6071050.1 RNA polymerase sigma-70 factor (ECF subfamily) [Longimicrobium terrae]NNC29071.1 sigma-70 family RNA polymerase sigma factor [Longimicrobium terrae]